MPPPKAQRRRCPDRSGNAVRTVGKCHDSAFRPSEATDGASRDVRKCHVLSLRSHPSFRPVTRIASGAARRNPCAGLEFPNVWSRAGSPPLAASDRDDGTGVRRCQEVSCFVIALLRFAKFHCRPRTERSGVPGPGAAVPDLSGRPRSRIGLKAIPGDAAEAGVSGNVMFRHGLRVGFRSAPARHSDRRSRIASGAEWRNPGRRLSVSVLRTGPGSLRSPRPVGMTERAFAGVMKCHDPSRSVRPSFAARK